MATFDEFLETKFEEARNENDREVLAAVERRDKDLVIRCENHLRTKMTAAERATHTVDSILQLIKTSAVVRSMFRKDPGRQSIHEKAQIDWIRMHLHSDAVKMRADIGGRCLSNRKFHEVVGTRRPSDSTKTLDLHVPSKNLFGILKYTASGGGAQDNQLRDVKHFVREAVGYLEDNPRAEECFALYLDGAYYTEKIIKGIEIPDALKSRIMITNCASILPK